jgi:hypothetical protein
MRAAFLLLPLSLSAACLRQTEYQCQSNNQCTPAGLCQTDVGYCSFSDSECASGQRFGTSAGPYANQCVGEQPGGNDGGIDAPMTDAPNAMCPADYAPLTGGNPNHVYKKAPNNLAWVQQDDYCRTTSARAYLAVPDDPAELTAIQGLATGTFWVGINDRVTEGTYLKSNGGTATVLPWATGQPDNAGGGTGQDCVAGTATTISDEDCTGGGANKPAACECELP